MKMKMCMVWGVDYVLIELRNAPCCVEADSYLGIQVGALCHGRQSIPVIDLPEAFYLPPLHYREISYCSILFSMGP